MREELTQLLAQPDRTTYVGCRDRFFIALLADTGLCLAEALGIRIGDIDFRTRSIAVMGKGRKPDRVLRRVRGRDAARLPETARRGRSR